MKKLVSIVLVAVFAVSLFAGCSDQSVKETDESSRKLTYEETDESSRKLTYDDIILLTSNIKSGKEILEEIDKIQPQCDEQCGNVPHIFKYYYPKTGDDSERILIIKDTNIGIGYRIIILYRSDDDSDVEVLGCYIITDEANDGYINMLKERKDYINDLMNRIDSYRQNLNSEYSEN